MVVIHIKRSENDQFLYETTCDTPNEQIIVDLAKISNTRILITALAEAVKGLAEFGPSKHPDKRGIDTIQEEVNNMDPTLAESIDKTEYYKPDPIGHRTGNGPGPQLASTINKVAQDALDAANSNLVLRKISLNLPDLKEKLENIRGAVTMAYPMGLPDYDPVHYLLKINIEDGKAAFDQLCEALAGVQASQDLLDPSSAQLWWAGKEFFRDEVASDRVGKNEKTKIVARLQKQGGGAPQREPAVSEEERKSMMAQYFKKQEELKKLAEADDEDYLHSSWANPAAMKNQLRGTANIRPF